MEITYERLEIYSSNKDSVKLATKELDILFTESYVEEQEVMDIAKKHNVVVLYETTESIGYSEVFLINNIGELEAMTTFGLDDVELKRQEIKNTSLQEVFDDIILEQIRIHMKEHEISERVFLEEYLDELLLDYYEQEKERLKSTVQTFFVK